MRTRWFDQDLDSVAIMWRVERRDGVALGFTTHDRNLWLQGFPYLSAPGMLPSAVEMDNGLENDAMDVRGALSHDLISEADLAAGRWDGARIMLGLADWTRAASGISGEGLDAEINWLFYGNLGEVERTGDAFSADLLGVKSAMDAPFVPHSSPSCRAEFCGTGCNLSRAAFEHVVVLAHIDDNGLRFDGADRALAADFVQGSIMWTDGKNAGLTSEIWREEQGFLYPAFDLPFRPILGDKGRLTAGCDKDFTTCQTRFNNAANFQGEPHLPGNDLLTRYSSGG